MMELYNSYASPPEDNPDAPAQISGESLNQFFTDLGLHQMGDEGQSLAAFFEEVSAEGGQLLNFVFSSRPM